MNNYRPPQPIEFGSAIVSGTILGLQKKEKVFEVLMRIDTVHGYGPSTPPLAVGSEITLLEENNSDRVFGKILKDKSEIELKLKIRTLPSRTTEERVWKVIIIYK